MRLFAALEVLMALAAAQAWTPATTRREKSIICPSSRSFFGKTRISRMSLLDESGSSEKGDPAMDDASSESNMAPDATSLDSPPLQKSIRRESRVGSLLEARLAMERRRKAKPSTAPDEPKEEVRPDVLSNDEATRRKLLQARLAMEKKQRDRKSAEEVTQLVAELANREATEFAEKESRIVAAKEASEDILQRAKYELQAWEAAPVTAEEIKEEPPTITTSPEITLRKLLQARLALEKKIRERKSSEEVAQLVSQLANKEAMEFAEKESRIAAAKEASEGILQQAKLDLQQEDNVKVSSATTETASVSATMDPLDQGAAQLVAKLATLEAMEFAQRESRIAAAKEAGVDVLQQAKLDLQQEEAPTKSEMSDDAEDTSKYSYATKSEEQEVAQLVAQLATMEASELAEKESRIAAAKANLQETVPVAAEELAAAAPAPVDFVEPTVAAPSLTPETPVYAAPTELLVDDIASTLGPVSPSIAFNEELMDESMSLETPTEASLEEVIDEVMEESTKELMEESTPIPPLTAAQMEEVVAEVMEELTPELMEEMITFNEELIEESTLLATPTASPMEAVGDEVMGESIPFVEDALEESIPLETATASSLEEVVADAMEEESIVFNGEFMVESIPLETTTATPIEMRGDEVMKESMPPETATTALREEFVPVVKETARLSKITEEAAVANIAAKLPKIDIPSDAVANIVAKLPKMDIPPEAVGQVVDFAQKAASTVVNGSVFLAKEGFQLALQAKEKFGDLKMDDMDISYREAFQKFSKGIKGFVKICAVIIEAIQEVAIMVTVEAKDANERRLDRERRLQEQQRQQIASAAAEELEQFLSTAQAMKAPPAESDKPMFEASMKDFMSGVDNVVSSALSDLQKPKEMPSVKSPSDLQPRAASEVTKKSTEPTSAKKSDKNKIARPFFLDIKD